MINKHLASIGMILVTSFMGVSLANAQTPVNTTLKPTPAPSKVCAKSQSLISWHLPVDPTSFNDFTYTELAYRCVANTLINQTNNAAPNSAITPYKKAVVAMKMLVNPTVLPPSWLVGGLKPFNFSDLGVCSAYQQTNGIYGWVLGTASSPKFKLCASRTSAGIGEDARSRVSAQKTLKIYYPLAVTNNIQILNRQGNPI
jgi:hypothetical protein